MSLRSKVLIASLCMAATVGSSLAWKTARDLRPLPASLVSGERPIRRPVLVERGGRPLSATYQNRWSIHTAPLHDMPVLLQQAFVESEDRRFFRHRGVDWTARLRALQQNLRAMRAVRGASTITEQVVRMIHPRPRTVWSRWLEGIEAARLESRLPKTEILEFYLNQVPYACRRRGVVEAARFYFDRDLDTLNAKETLALAVLVRAPSGLDLRRRPGAIEKRTAGLAAHMLARGLLTGAQYRGVLEKGFDLARSDRIVDAPHFVRHVFKNARPDVLTSGGRIETTLDGNLQETARHILQNRVEALRESEVGSGALLVVDNRSGEVLAWASATPAEGESGSWIDAVTAPRQPGSTLKPFLYALAMELGWTPATLIEDSPLAERVGSGLHHFRNYSRTYYGPLRLREALGNSLNTPAVRTIEFTGTGRFLDRLRRLGIASLAGTADFYGKGLALGDGEVSLFELVQAYSALARRGRFLPLRCLPERYESPGEERQAIDPKAAYLVSDILSDPQARRLEFGEGHLLRFPVRTAIKTGTSTDHRDSWAVGFTDRYTAGVWMGNLDRRPTRGISGAIGPALVLRSIFAELGRGEEPPLLPANSGLASVSICSVTGMLAGPDCPRTLELFEPGTSPAAACSLHNARAKDAAPPKALARGEAVRLIQPTPGLQLAIDPRIPPALQAFYFKIPESLEVSGVEWVLDREVAGRTGPGRHKFLWRLRRGTHLAKARIWSGGEPGPVETPEVAFVVK